MPYVLQETGKVYATLAGAMSGEQAYLRKLTRDAGWHRAPQWHGARLHNGNPRHYTNEWLTPDGEIQTTIRELHAEEYS